MTEKKFSNKNFIILIAIAAALLVCSVAIIYAVSFSVQKDYSFLAVTDTLSVNSTGEYYANLNSGASVNITRVRDSESKLETTAFDLIVFTTGNATASGFSAPDLGNRYFVYQVLNDGIAEKCFIFKNIAVSGQVSATGLSVDAGFRVVVVPSKVSYDGGAAMEIPNIYISGFFGLKLANNQTYYNENSVVANIQTYANIFFISDFVIDEAFTLSVPAYINSLYATVSLQRLTIKHSYSGLFVVETINGQFDATGELPAIIIDTPFAYYQTAQGVDDAIVQKLNNNANITAEQLEAICDDALTFALGRLEQYTFKSVSLPLKYQNYETAISYDTVFALGGGSASAVFSPQGIVNRQSSTTDVTVQATVAIASKGVTKSANRTISIAGTSNAALTEIFSAMLDNQIRLAYANGSDGQDDNIYNFNRSMDTAKLSMDFVKNSQVSSLTVKAVLGGEFTHGGDIFDTYVLTTVADNIMLAKTAGGQSVGSTVSISATEKIYLQATSGSSVLKLEVSISGSNQELLYNVVKSKQDIIDLIENNMSTPFVASINTGSNIYYLENGQLKNDSSQTIEDSNIMSITDIESGVISLSQEEYEALLANPQSIDSFLTSHNDDTYFDFTDTQVLAVSLMSATDRVYVLWQKFAFEEDIYEDDSPYTAFRKIEIPSAGISGGSEYEEYMRGDYFAGLFSGNSKIIDGAAIGNLITDSNVYMNVSCLDSDGNLIEFLKFKADYFVSGSTQTITFDYTEVSVDNGGHSVYFVDGVGYTYDNVDIKLLRNFYFYIDIARVPITNTSANFEVEFFYIDREGEVVSINTETYSFIIPGIYRNSDFDANIYNFLIYCINDAERKYADLDGSFQPENIEQYVYQGFLLTDGAGLFLSLDATKNNIETALGISISGETETKGIEYLVKLERLNLSGLTLANLDGIERLDDLPLRELLLSNCGITDAKLDAKLSDLRNLITVDLSQNQITSIADILYRTVTNLNLSGQKFSATQVKSLTSIEGVERLYELITLDLSDNAILSFEPLRQLAALKSVKVFGNTVNVGSISTTYSANFGTSGTANIPVYVQLTVSGVSVFANSLQQNEKVYLDRAAATESSGGDLSYLTLGQWNSALVLNAIVYKGVQDIGAPELLPSVIVDGSGAQYTLSQTVIADLTSASKSVSTLRITGHNGSEVYSTTVTRLFVITLQ